MSVRSQEGEFGVSARRWMPLAWRPREDHTPAPERVAALNQTNEKRLKTILGFETRETPSAQLATLEALVVEVLRSVKQPPTSHSVVLSSHNIQWIQPGAHAPRISAGDFGLVRLYLSIELPYEVEFFAEVFEVNEEAQGWRVTAELKLRSEPVVDLYQQLIFIYYRRARRDKTIDSAEGQAH